VNRKLLDKFTHTQCRFYFVGKNRAPIELPCVMFQFGEVPVIFDDKLQCAAEVSRELADSAKVSIRVPNLDAVAAFEKNVKAEFQSTVTGAIGQKLIYKDQLPFHTNTYHDMVWKGDTISKHVGMATIHTDSLDEVLRRSGINGVFIYTLGRNEYAIIRLPGSTTLVETRAKCGLLGTKHYGLITVGNGFAIRVDEWQKLECEKILKPELMTLIGDSLLTTRRSDCVQLEACGVPKDFSECDLVQQTAMVHSGCCKWTCRPSKNLRSSAPGLKKRPRVSRDASTEEPDQSPVGGQVVFGGVQTIHHSQACPVRVDQPHDE
jgi:hypothetical protein